MAKNIKFHDEKKTKSVSVLLANDGPESRLENFSSIKSPAIFLKSHIHLPCFNFQIFKLSQGEDDC